MSTKAGTLPGNKHPDKNNGTEHYYYWCLKMFNKNISRLALYCPRAEWVQKRVQIFLNNH